MADGGAITLRMSLQGAEQVRAELAKVGPAGNQMAREIDRAMRQPTAGMKALDAGAKEARTSFENFASGAGPAGSFLQQLGPWGTAAAASLVAVGLAAVATMRQLREAMAFAAELTDTADRVGVGAEELQKWRFVSDEAGVSVATFEANLEKLNGTVGAFKIGIGDAKLKPIFEELGISKDQLANVDDATDMMLLLADTLGQVKDRAVQVRLARGLGVEDSLPILRLGSDRIRELTGQAEELGLVMSDDVRKGFDDADRAIEIAQQRIDMSLRVAVAGLADDFANVVEAIAQVIVWLTKLNSVKIENPGVVAGQWVNDQARRALGMGPNPARADRLARQNGWVSQAGDWNRAEVTAGLQALATPEKPGFDPQGHTSKGGGGGGGPSAAERERDRRIREAQREVDRLQGDDFDAQREWLREVIAGRDTAEDRARAARLLLSLDEEEARVALDKVKATIEAGGLMTEEVQQRLQHIETLRGDVANARRKQIDEREARDRAEAVNRAEAIHADIQAEILSLASINARTSGERRDIELHILELAQRRQRADLEAAIEAEKEPVARARLVQALENLPRLQAAQRDRVARDNAGPVAAWWDGQRTAGEAQEWVQAEALDALDGVNRGLIDAWRNADSAGDAFDRMGKVAVDALGRVADALLEVALQRMLIQPLANSLFGGGSGGGGGLLGNFLGGLVGGVMGGSASPVGDSGGLLPGSLMKGMARGGVQGARGLVPVGEYGIELMDMPAGARIYDTERTERMIRDAAMGGGRGAVAGGPPIVNMPVKVINNGSERMNATTRQTPEGIDVILDPIIRNKVTEMGGDGSLAKANALAPKGKTR